MAAHTYPIIIDQGSEWSFVFTYSTKDPSTGVTTPVNLTGYTATMRIATDVTDENNQLSLSSPSSGIVLGTSGVFTNGKVTITITDEQSWTLTPGSAVYNIEVTPSGGNTRRLLKGPVTIVAGVPL